MAEPPPIIHDSPAPPILAETESSPSTGPMARFLSILLSLCLAAFIVDGLLSVLDQTLAVLFGIHPLAAPRALAFLLAALLAIVVYLLMGFTRRVPKRVFLPLTLFNFLGTILLIPFLIYHYDEIEQGGLVMSCIQLALGLGVFVWGRGEGKSRWLLVGEERLGHQGFGWLNLVGFALANLFVLLPGIAVYLAFSAALAVDHFSGGFLSLRSDGLTARATKFVRDDGKSIELIPMMHVGEPSFYRRVTNSFPTNSIILLEGVSDRSHLIQEKLSYKRLASSLGLVEQQSGFVPGPVSKQSRRADVDVSEFSKSTIELLNLVARVHAEGLGSQAFLDAIRHGEDPDVAKQLWEDILFLRNRHLLEEIQSGLRESDVLVVPWGAAHMPGVAEGIRTLGFKSSDTEEFKVVLFRTVLARLFAGRK